MASGAMDRLDGRLKKARLYGILDLGYVAPENLMPTAEALVKGGAGVLQLRAKDNTEAEVLALLQNGLSGLLPMCREHQVPFIVNDFPQVAAEIGADGVHVGQDDGSLASVRAVVGQEMLVGRSTHSPEQAQAALDEGFDYIGFGPLFPTPTKQGRPGIGIKEIASVQKRVGAHIPVFCIGGIKPDNLETVLAAGAKRVVIVSALLQAEDAEEVTRAVVKNLG